MARKKVETLINDKIYPFVLNGAGKSCISRLVRLYSYDFLIECIDICVPAYLDYGSDGTPTRESVGIFIRELEILAHGRAGFTLDEIGADGDEEVTRVPPSEVLMPHETQKRDCGGVLPPSLFENAPLGLRSLCRQINISYGDGLFDCTATVMRRLLESLLILSYRKADIEDEILSTDGKHHISLDKIIKNAQNSEVLALSASVRRNMDTFRDIGNYSSHKLWYNCTREDLEPYLLRYRVMIEELLYKAGLR